jgi:hypothetical protein
MPEENRIPFKKIEGGVTLPLDRDRDALSIAPATVGVGSYYGLPAGTLALYGDFSMSSAVAYKANGLQIASSVDAGFAKDQVVFRGTQRVGISNHDASFVAKLVIGS